MGSIFIKDGGGVVTGCDRHSERQGRPLRKDKLVEKRLVIGGKYNLFLYLFHLFFLLYCLP